LYKIEKNPLKSKVLIPAAFVLKKMILGTFAKFSKFRVLASNI